MSETKAPETIENTTTPEPDIQNFRDTPAFKALIARTTAAEAELQSIKAKEAERERLAMEEKAKQTGDFEEWKKAEKARHDSEIAAAKADIRKAKIDALTAGIPDEWRRKGIAADLRDLPEDVDLSAHVSELRKTAPDLWESKLPPVQGSTQQGGRVTSVSGDLTKAALDEMIKSGDETKKKDAIQYRVDYYNKHGFLPK